MYLEKSDKVEDYKLKERRLTIPFTITGHATPASKTSSTDLAPLYLSTEGRTATAAAVDSGCNFTTASDSTGVFGLLLTPGAVARKVLRVAVEQRSGTTATNKVQATVLNGASSTGITASGNIAVSATCAGLDLSAENFDGVLVIEYMIE